MDAKKHLDKCFSTENALLALLHESSGINNLIFKNHLYCSKIFSFNHSDGDGVFGVYLDVPQIGDVAEYLIENKVVQSTLVEEKTILAPQIVDYEAEKVLSTRAIIPFTISPKEFWIQLEPGLVESTIMERLDELATDSEFINNKNFVPSVGSPCLVYLADDQRWYRAVVQAVDGDNSVVHYIDYGNGSTVSNADLRRLPANLAQQPAMAFKCCLDGAQEVSKEIKDAFELLAVEIEATVTYVKTVDGLLHVRLSTSDGEDVAEKIGLSSNSKEIEVCVCYSTSPSNFWIHKKQDEAKLTKMQDDLFSVVGGPNTESSKLQGTPVVGQRYCVYYPEYSSWYRGQVTSLGSDKAEVQFIDYGDKHSVPFSDIRNLPEQLKRVPPFAIHSSLNLDLSEKEMPQEAVSYFETACSNDAICQVTFGSKVDNIQLIDSMKTETDNIIEVVNDKIKSSLIQRVVEHLEDSLDPSSKSMKPLQSHVYPIIRSSTELVTDSFPGNMISSGASAVCLTSPSAVWLHLDPAAADALMDGVKQYVTRPEFAKMPPFEPFVGCCCLAFCTDDNTWYRAIVESVLPDSVVVFYADYGNSAPVDLHHLQALPQSLTEQPALALKCALDGIERNPNDLPSVPDCQQTIFAKKLSVTFVEKTEKHIFVRLRDESGTDLNDTLRLPAMKTNPVSAPIPTNGRVIPGAIPVSVSHIKSASMFWIHRKEKEAVLEQIRSVLRPLDGNDPDNAIDVREGQLYAVMHPDYSRYYRARVNKVQGEDVEVFFLDYGHTHWVSLANVRPCPEMLEYIPAMATECTFRTPIFPNQYSEEIEKAFSDATEGVECQAVFSNPLTETGIQYVEALYAKGVNIADLLNSVGTAARNGNSGTFSK